MIQFYSQKEYYCYPHSKSNDSILTCIKLRNINALNKCLMLWPHNCVIKEGWKKSEGHPNTCIKRKWRKKKKNKTNRKKKYRRHNIQN